MYVQVVFLLTLLLFRSGLSYYRPFLFSLGVFPYASMSDAEALSSIVGGCTLERPTDSDPEM